MLCIHSTTIASNQHLVPEKDWLAVVTDAKDDVVLLDKKLFIPAAFIENCSINEPYSKYLVTRMSIENRYRGVNHDHAIVMDLITHSGLDGDAFLRSFDVTKNVTLASCYNRLEADDDALGSKMIHRDHLVQSAEEIADSLRQHPEEVKRWRDETVPLLRSLTGNSGEDAIVWQSEDDEPAEVTTLLDETIQSFGVRATLKGDDLFRFCLWTVLTIPIFLCVLDGQHRLAASVMRDGMTIALGPHHGWFFPCVIVGRYDALHSGDIRALQLRK